MRSHSHSRDIYNTFFVYMSLVTVTIIKWHHQCVTVSESQCQWLIVTQAMSVVECRSMWQYVTEIMTSDTMRWWHVYYLVGMLTRGCDKHTSLLSLVLLIRFDGLSESDIFNTQNADRCQSSNFVCGSTCLLQIQNEAVSTWQPVQRKNLMLQSMLFIVYLKMVSDQHLKPGSLDNDVLVHVCSNFQTK